MGLVMDAGSGGSGETLQQLRRIVPIDTPIRDALTVGERLPWARLLATGDEEAFDHHAHNPLLASGNLRGDVVSDCDLPLMIFSAIGMTNIND